MHATYIKCLTLNIKYLLLKLTSKNYKSKEKKIFQSNFVVVVVERVLQLTSQDCQHKKKIIKFLLQLNEGKWKEFCVPMESNV